MKRVRPTWFQGGDTVSFLWPIDEPVTEEARDHAQVIAEVASSAVALGWGTDLVVGHAALVTDTTSGQHPGESWEPCGPAAARDGLRVPIRGTLEALAQRHQRFLSRIELDGCLDPKPPLSAYATVEYRRAVDPPSRPFAGFSLLRPDASGWVSFDVTRRGLSLAGMIRHAAAAAAEQAGWPKATINAAVLGHGEDGGSQNHQPVPRRFAYLPLPSIEARGPGRVRVGAVRRFLLTSFSQDLAGEVAWARRELPGQELVSELGVVMALVSLIPETDGVVRRYVAPTSTWATVTPVVLPGHDDPSHYRRRMKRGVSVEEQRRLLQRLDARIDGLLRKAITQAGFSEVLAENAHIEWSRIGFWPGTSPAERYGVPDHLKCFSRLHVRIQWRSAAGEPIALRGPICLGGGRYYGLGLLAALDG
jgi:CRISPR-associated protein Csb2